MYIFSYVHKNLPDHPRRACSRLWCDISVKNRYPGCKRSKLHASVRNFMQAFVTSCKRFKNFMQAVQNFMQAVPKLYASGPKLYASVRNFMQAFVTVYASGPKLYSSGQKEIQSAWKAVVSDFCLVPNRIGIGI